MVEDLALFIEALETFENDADVDGTPHPHLPAIDELPTAPLGPR